MKIEKFDIRNFKGITNSTVHISDDVPGNVVTLIGLNESGKTTILEALSYFGTEERDTAKLVGTVHKKSTLQDLIPKDKKAAFTGPVSIKATCSIEKEDVEALSAMFLQDHNLVMDESSIHAITAVTRTYDFVDSKYQKVATYWSQTSFRLRTKTAKKFKDYKYDDATANHIWLSGVNLLGSRLPKIVYFPTFLFDFPDRIYLQGVESDINSYYAQVIQDVLDSQGEDLTIEKHIIDRINSAKKEHSIAATFFSFFFQRDEKKMIDAVLQKASNEMSKVIFGSWNQILGKNITGKRVEIEWLLDGDRNNSPYLEVSIIDGQSKYSLSERSLGFRWFFSFLLFTQFRKNRKGNHDTLFLFDEPAANLHSKAQMKLLETFSRIANGSTYIIYSTHSHYMVNPLWLDKAYIIENKALDYDNENDVDAFSIRKTDILSIRYKTFVGSNPTKTTYFQPVLDALDVSFSPLVRSNKGLIVEGKGDFFALKFLGRSSEIIGNIDIFPCNGAGTMSTLISLFRGWGVDFRIILDDDNAGRQARKKYQNELLVKGTDIKTLADFNSDLSGKVFEDLYQDDIINDVKGKFLIDRPNKEHYAIFLQHLLIDKIEKKYLKTEESFQPIFDWLESQF